MGKACTQILVTQPDEEWCLTYLGLLDRVLSHDAFTPSHKRRLQSWKGQCQKLARQLATNRKLAGIEKGPKNWYDPLGSGIALGKRRPTSRTSSLKGSGSGSLLHIPLARAGPLVATQNMHKRVTLTNSYNNMNRNSHQSLSRTKSAPIRSNILLQPPHIGQQDADGINKSLETLCLSMTNHALEDTPEKSEVGFEEWTTTTTDPVGWEEKCKPKLKTIDNRKPKCCTTLCVVCTGGWCHVCLFVYLFVVCFVCLFVLFVCCQDNDKNYLLQVKIL